MSKGMKVLVGVVLSLILCGGVATAQGIKVGYVDLEKVFNDYYRTQEENAKLQDVQKAKKAEADRLVSEINKLKEEAELLSDDAKKGKEAVVNQKIKELRDYEKDTVQEIRDKLLALRKDILDTISKVVEEKGKKEGYTMVMVSDVLIYKDPTLDMTGDVLKVLNKGHEGKPASAAGPATPAPKGAK